MKSTQMFEAIINGDVDVTYFQCWLHEQIQDGYLEGYSDCNQDEVREQFLSECG